MSLDIVLLTPRRRFIANQFGLGYQIPLGLVFLGGPLVDAGHRVRLIDNDVLGWNDQRLARELSSAPPDCILIGHTGSTAAHPVAMETARVLREHLPSTKIIYGGVYPSYASCSVLRANPAIDVIVRGEGEATMVELAQVLSKSQKHPFGRLRAHPERSAAPFDFGFASAQDARRAVEGGDLQTVKGITWRDGATIRVNPARAPIADLDQFRPGWELVDWEGYSLFGFGRAAGMQFSRGCPLTCTYCGQWNFWKRWRHRSPENFARELEVLAKRYGVRIVWLADENFAADREAAREALEKICERDLGLSLNLNMTAADVVRDADLLPLYKRAGVDNIIMGIESLDDATVARVRKNNPLEVSREAVSLLRQQGIASLVNVIYGLETENTATVARTFRGVFDLDPDILNAVYITPHFWTPAGRQVRPDQIIQPNQTLWTYRNQIVHTPHLSPWRLFLTVKLTEALFHLRPRALLRMLLGHDPRFRRILRAYLTVGFRVVLAEMWEFIFHSRFVLPGSLSALPGAEELKELTR